ncbi:MAG: GNAT family N-acetyltransferase [Oscillospiraceae bacterium]|nr:GNAT family N-acetyltransferase [Oscillospiraceae bacterium]
MSHTIRAATPADEPALRTLYHDAFDAPKAELDRFFGARFVPEQTRVLCADERLCAALYLLPGEVVCAGERFSADYIYAAATEKSQRGQGLMRDLLAGLSSRADLLVLAPADAGLFSYYEKQGFRTAFYRKELTLPRRVLAMIAGEDKPAAIVSRYAEEYLPALHTLRDTLFSRTDGFRWPLDGLGYALLDHNVTGRTLIVTEEGTPAAYVLLEEEGDAAYISECVLGRVTFVTMVAALLGESAAETFHFRLPPDFPLSADGFVLRPIGMLRALTAEGTRATHHLRGAYLGLTLD